MNALRISFRQLGFTPSMSMSTSSSHVLNSVLSTSAVLLLSLPVTPFSMNQYMLCCKTTNTAALIDCGDDNIERWLDAAEEEGMTITKILQTHGHVDHVR